MVIVIVVVNLILQIFYAFLSKFERHKYLSQEMSAKILKVFLGQFVNTGIIILVTNLRIEAPTEGAIWY